MNYDTKDNKIVDYDEVTEKQQIHSILVDVKLTGIAATY